MNSETYKAILDTVPSPIVFVDNDHVIRHLNKAARVRYYEQRGHQNLVGKSVFDCHNPVSVDAIKGIHGRLLAGENEVFLKVNRNGERITVVGVRDAAGCLMGYYERFEAPTEPATPPYSEPSARSPQR